VTAEKLSVVCELTDTTDTLSRFCSASSMGLVTEVVTWSAAAPGHTVITVAKGNWTSGTSSCFRDRRARLPPTKTNNASRIVMGA
jgi:hypothetical protein